MTVWAIIDFACATVNLLLGLGNVTSSYSPSRKIGYIQLALVPMCIGFGIWALMSK